MKSRFVLGVLIVGVCLALLAMSAGFNEESSRAWRIGSLAAVAAFFFVAMWARDRFLPPKKLDHMAPQRSANETPDGATKVARRYWSPWMLAGASLALIAASLMVVMRVDATETNVTRLMFRVGAWGVLVVTVAVSVASPPRAFADRFAHWWLPGSVLIFIAYVATGLVPELVKLITGKVDAEHPNVATLIFVPVAVFAWRSIQLIRSTSNRS